jgi:hypothetical protein
MLERGGVCAGIFRHERIFPMVSRQVRLQRHVVARCSAHADRAVIGGIMTGASITAAHLIDLVRSFPRQRGKRKTVASHTRGSEPDRFAGFRRATAYGATSPSASTTAKDRLPPIPAVRHSRRGGRLRGQAPGGLRLLGAVPHPSPECPRPAPPHPRERQSRIGPVRHQRLGPSAPLPVGR